MIGVGESVDELLREHLSISRCLVQIQMPRMTDGEVKDIINTGISRLNMTITDEALIEIISISKGLPYYTHLIGLNATRNALSNLSLNINIDDIKASINKAIEDSNHSIKTGYYNAIRSGKKGNLFADVLLSCALADVDKMGEFSCQSLKIPLKDITGKDYEIPAFAQHLKEFTEEKRGQILIKTGVKKRFRYKFSDPLMQPFIIMQGIKENKI